MPTIFLVEDNVADVELFRMALEDASVQCDLVVFGDGRQAIDYILNPDSALPPSPPDLIILDLNLPKHDGLEVLQVLRGAPAFAKVSIVVLSSSSSSRERTKLAAFNIREFIAKPSDIDAYLSIGRIVANLLDETAPQSGDTAKTVPG